jgi:hypothetical protein
MALWEYKVITSGLHGFASPALMETHLNTLGKDEWEIIHFQTLPNNPLAFNGLARRSTMRDWVPPEIAAAASSPPRPTAYEPAPSPAKSAHAPAQVDEKPELPPAVSAEAEPSKQPAGSKLRAFRDTERDLDPQAQDEDEDWDSWEDNQDELPTFFEAIKPLMRRNQKGAGQSVGVDHLARRWEIKESDVAGALKECGLTIPETEEQDPEYFEFEGDLFWVNRNNRGQLFVNSREKPRPAFRIAKASKLAADDPASAELAGERAAEKAEIEKQKTERLARQAAADAAREASRLAREKRDAERAANAAATSASAAEQPGKESAAPVETKVLSGPLPPEAEILEKIRPQMRRNRRGPGYSGSISFLARALNMSEADLSAAFAVLGLNTPENANDKPVYVEIDGAVYWINKDGRGGVWINGREKRDGARPASSEDGEGNAGSGEPTGSVPSAEAAPGPASTGPLDEDKPAALANVPAQTASDPTPDAEAPQNEESPDRSSARNEEPSAAASAPGGHPALTAVRLLLKANKRGSGVSGEVGFLARTLEKSEDAFLGTLMEAGLVLPPDSDAKPVFVEQAGEIFWLNKNSTDGSLWLNAKASKSAGKKTSAGASAKPRSRKPKSADKSGE